MNEVTIMQLAEGGKVFAATIDDASPLAAVFDKIIDEARHLIEKSR